MLIWNPGKLTKDGKALLAKAQAGKCAIQINKGTVGKWLIYFERGHLTENCAEDREAEHSRSQTKLSIQIQHWC
mgnify:CR=1 FL=1